MHFNCSIKKILSITVLTVASLHSLAQSTDTLSKPYKNNLQTNVFGVIGYFSLQYEHALNKKMSMSLISTFNYPYLSSHTSPNDFEYNINVMPQLRLYTQKTKKKYNQGFYLSLSCNFSYYQYYSGGSYNPTTNDVLLGHHTYASGYYYEDNISRQKKAVYIGAGAGYQWVIKKHLVLDLGMDIQYAIFQQERFKNIPIQNEWEKAYYYSGETSFHFTTPVSCNIGYAF